MARLTVVSDTVLWLRRLLGIRSPSQEFFRPEIGAAFLAGFRDGLESPEKFKGFTPEVWEMLHNSASLLTFGIEDEEDEDEDDF